MRINFLDLLFKLSDFDRQLSYKDAVPFVHIPIELDAQMCQFKPEWPRSCWYKDVLPNADVKISLLALYEVLDLHFDTCARRRSDVPAVFERGSWKRVRDAAQAVISELYQAPEYQDTLASYWMR